MGRMSFVKREHFDTAEQLLGKLTAIVNYSTGEQQIQI